MQNRNFLLKRHLSPHLTLPARWWLLSSKLATAQLADKELSEGHFYKSSREADKAMPMVFLFHLFETGSHHIVQSRLPLTEILLPLSPMPGPQPVFTYT